MKSIVVLYHANCPDGFGAAYAAWKKFGNRADYIAVKPVKLPPKHLRNKEIYVLDSSLSADDLKRLLQLKNKVTIIDHHISSKKDVEKAPNYVFDIEHSGAVLTWKYFHHKKRTPKLLQYVENGDLWKFHLPNSQLLLAYVYSLPYDFKIWENLCRGMEKAAGRKKYLTLGKIISDYNAIIIKEVVDKAELVKLGKYKVLAVNHSLRKFTDKVGHELYRRKPPFSIIWHVGKEGIKVSLRSNGSVDVSKIAARYVGGGGHRAAASFTLPRNAKLPWKVLKN
ncbi:MAG: Phosphoesterase, DHHA1 [Candidatus Jorgensenbacteria bacterium GW2011_GWA1_48_13]|uniref:Phosphoesterase, DHHA1 n=2 Tax=Candidatus Joergenseniibacteriota TaxID=1752739 RepID=A0A0G1Z7U4_9BACT|nr:MAG: Phosphoesterase, DHHA1 [Candidatus Jorgensenbacteria bacterium GW2011_GWA1_48_13]KKU98596.1 MAG: Phosphoesterase, dhha1 [Candidatus Jorgensenbacteria bacterium GW2011_GWC1_48_8]KKW15049.1 MAG: Phosphoesterase, DHHA1 [Candidatus Jorgensenbacteria bacterium GW2011_GWB1_50_10]